MSLIYRLALLALLLPAAAVANDDIYVPDDLQQWREWVLHDKGYRACPFIFDRSGTQRGDYICAWPGLLALSVDANGGEFEQSWSVYADQQWVQLPGNTDYWPNQVTANGRSIEVVLHDNIPSVYLEPGAYRLTGSFAWDQRPGTLNLPAQTGLISLRVDGQVVARPDRNNSAVFLGKRQQETQARDNVSSDVYRLIRDDVPTLLTTRILLQVSGGVREELFGPLLPEGFVPLAINSVLPARLEPDGSLRVQLRPGSWEVTISARSGAVLDSIGMPAPQRNMPDTEIWSYASNDALRVTAPEGLAPVDPQQLDVPAAWIELPAFRISAGESLKIVERSRGIVSAENDLRLSRTMWLAFDRSGFILSDDITGTMRTDWRLDMSPPFALLAASADSENLLITDGENEGQTGIELRQPHLAVEASSSTLATGALPVNAWDTGFTAVETVLNLPPGHKLLAAPGVDVAQGSWASQWQLLDFFLVLIVAVASWRLFGAKAGVIAFFALVLSFHELAAPAWLWLNLLVAIALLRVAPAGRLRQTVRIYQGVSAALLVIALLPFAANQIRLAIYPQLEAQYSIFDAFDARQVPQGPRGEVLQMEAMPVDGYLEDDAVERKRDESNLLSASKPARALEEVTVTASRSFPVNAFNRVAPSAVVQAGAGIPSWQWNTYRLSWGGPVEADQTMRLLIMPRWLVSMLRILEVGLLLLFVAVLAAEVLNRPFKLPGGLNPGRAAASGLASVGLLLMTMLPGQQVQAQTPDAELLKALESRLLAAPDCTPRCAEMVAADITIDAQSIRMTLTVHALEEVAVPLPGSDSGWRPASVLLNGSAAGQISRDSSQALWLRLQPGRHSVVLSGPIAAVDSLEIPFPTPPRVVVANSDAWLVAGIKDRRLLSGSLQLTRLETQGDADGPVRWESSRFPPFVKVWRTVQLDLDWYVVTNVQRIAPVEGALTLELPLLEGESVLTEDMTVKDGKILVSMAPDRNSVSWRSKLELVSPISLKAEQGVPWQEVWWVAVGNIWHAEFAGVPESESESFDQNARVALFYPRGGETLTVQATRPQGSAGSTLAFDAVLLHAAHGDRSSEVTMTLDYRSTRGAQHAVKIPKDAEVSSVLIDGRKQSLGVQDGVIDLPILPGEHNVRVTWRTDGEVGTRLSTPAVDIGAQASNITLGLDLPANRWLLGTSGPRLGPAVLYWSELAVLVLAALLLGRTTLAPLNTWQWLLLGLGFSTFAWSALGMVVAWLLLCGARERWHGQVVWWHYNLVQVAFAGLTAVALGIIVTNIPSGLLGVPDMHVAGNASYGNALKWFADQSETVLPTAFVVSVPMWVYKVLILGWALWLSFALLRWLPWVWRCFSSQGYWRPRERVVTATENDE